LRGGLTMRWTAKFEFEGDGKNPYRRERVGPGDVGDPVERVAWGRRETKSRETNDITATELRAWALPLLATIDECMGMAEKDSKSRFRVHELCVRAKHLVEEGVMLAVKGAHAREWTPEKYANVTLVDGGSK